MSQISFDFTVDDLQANRSGQLTRSQREWLGMTAQGIRHSSRRGTWIALVFVLAGTGILVLMFSRNDSSQKVLASSGPDLPYVILGVALIVALLTLSRIIANRTARRLASSQLQIVRGKARFGQSYSPGSAVTAYYLYVGKKRFSFSEEIGPEIVEGAEYFVYYCKANVYNLIMSFEKVE